ncbi:MAG: MFS transporter, partial [Candidatus Dormibacteraceae bacterium]
MSSAQAAIPSTRIRHLTLNSGWFGLNFHWLPIGAVLLQAQIHQFVTRQQEALAIGAIIGAGGVLAVIVPPLTGLLSDRLHTPWGRRRPVIVVGIIGNLLGLVVMFTASAYLQLFVGYLLIQLFNNAATAAYAAIIPDLVPAEEFGQTSGVLSA